MLLKAAFGSHEAGVRSEQAVTGLRDLPLKAGLGDDKIALLELTPGELVRGSLNKC